MVIGAALPLSGPFTAKSSPIPVPGGGSWPVVAVLLEREGDTLAVVRGAIELGPGYRHLLSLLVAPNLSLWFICSSTIGKAPIRGIGPNPPDTLYVHYLGLPPGKYPPVC